VLHSGIGLEQQSDLENAIKHRNEDRDGDRKLDRCGAFLVAAENLQHH